MRIENAIIKNVTVWLDHRERLTVSMELHNSCEILTANFILVNPVVVKNLTQIMKYTNVTKLTDLEGKIVRVGILSQWGATVIGHPIEDKFVDITNKVLEHIKELSKAEVLKEYS